MTSGSAIRFVRVGHAVLCACAVSAAAFACSDDGGGGSGIDGTGGSGQGGSGGGAATSGSAASGTGLDGGAAASGTGQGGDSGEGGGFNVFPGLDGCAFEEHRTETIPLDMYIMFDQSGSMSVPAGEGTRLEEVRAAMTDFALDPASQGINVGMAFFGFHPFGETSCDPGSYSSPAVNFGMLTDYANVLIATMNTIEPTGETPTGAAIRGACEYTRTWAQANPSHRVVVLLITDGVPEAPVSRDPTVTPELEPCDPNLADAVAATQECVSSSPVDVYVLGVGPNLGALNEIAVAGGTEQAYLAEGADVSTEVAAALNAIRGAAILPCDLTIPEPPPGETLNYNEVNVLFNRSGEVEPILYAETVERCDPTTGGWYYDDILAPTRILLCPATCGTVTSQSVGNALRIGLGCNTIPIQ